MEELATTFIVGHVGFARYASQAMAMRKGMEGAWWRLGFGSPGRPLRRHGSHASQVGGRMALQLLFHLLLPRLP